MEYLLKFLVTAHIKKVNSKNYNRCIATVLQISTVGWLEIKITVIKKKSGLQSSQWQHRRHSYAQKLYTVHGQTAPHICHSKTWLQLFVSETLSCLTKTLL